MKRLFLTLVAGVVLVPATAPGSAATDYYINNGIVDAGYGSNCAPTIDALNFVNRGMFSVYADGYTYYDYRPFQTWNTLNYTNSGAIYAWPGFRFDFSDSSMFPNYLPKPSASFVNAGVVDYGSAFVYSYEWLFVNATNIVNRGILAVPDSGLIQLAGDNVDLSRGSILVQAPNGVGGGVLKGEMFENYWGIGTNRLDAMFAPTFAMSSPMTVMGFDRENYYVQQNNTIFANDIVAYVNKVAPGVGADTTVDVLIIGNDNPDVVAEGKFETMDGPTTKVVRWEGYVTNRVTGLITTNQLYLVDSITSYAEPDYVTNVISYSSGDFTARPQNYRVTASYSGFDMLPPLDVVVLDPMIFDGTNSPIQALNTSYAITLTPAPHSPDPSLAGSTYSNLAGRVEIVANKVLNLSRSQIEGGSFLRIESTNHFVGSANSSIITPYASISLASTNSVMAITNLISPSVPCINGIVEVWSGRWTNANEMDGTVLYNVTIVHSNLRPSAEPYVDRLNLSVTNLVISDLLNVVSDSKIDCESLTVTFNGTNAPTQFGQLNLTGNGLVWAAALPKLRYLTNNGYITTANAAFFAGARTPPWSSGAFDEPYESFVNGGYVGTQGNDTWSRYFESSGTNNSGVGPLSVRADTAVIRNGSLEAGEDVVLNATGLSVSNQVIEAARTITLAVSDRLSDGSLEAGSAGVESGNTFTAGGGINLLQLPARSSLLATTVKLSAYANAEVVNRWAGADRGCSASGFYNNAALGYLALDGGLNSVFTFMGTGSSNAIYVNVLELNNFAGVYDAAETAIPGIDIKPGMKIYFAKAIVNGDDSPEASEKLNGKNNGLFCFVSDFAGTPPYVEVTTPGDGGSDSGDTEDPANAQPALTYPTIPSPYQGSPTIIGSYQGLIYNPDVVTLAGSGSIKLSVNNRGVYSGRIKLGGKNYPISGKLVDGRASFTVNGNPVTFRVSNDGFGKVEGTLGSSTIIADRIEATGAKFKSPYAGRYTFTIPSGDGLGTGYGTVLITPSATLVINVTLGDGTKLNQTLAVSRDGVCPLYASLYAGKGMVISWLEFAEDAGFEGNLLWMRSETLAVQTKFEGSDYNTKPANKRAITLFEAVDGGHGALSFSGGGLTEEKSVTVILGKNNKVKFPEGGKVSLQILPGTGLFQGTFRVDGVSKAIQFKGALRQDKNFGAGLFIYNGVPGVVRLAPPE